ncbi:nmrA-like family domain-containing protein 1 [Amblyraja radiata]|uniref:nmrA-like family domain-containing protein 1 n=1 Tax=Amblyraja radiata TaxID=386614 RepID=UPI001402C997|nr:nmrA-like family domain-containing protein 1 [Amblyraja radiata]
MVCYITGVDSSGQESGAYSERVANISGKLGVKHIVFSGLENVTKLTKGKLEVPHFDGKGEKEDYFREHGAPITSIRIAVNFLNVFKPVKTDIAMEGLPLDGVSVRDLGEVVGAILKNLKVHAGKETGLSTDKRTVDNILEKPSKTPRIFQLDMKLPARNKDPTLKLNPNAKSFDEWMSEKND